MVKGVSAVNRDRIDRMYVDRKTNVNHVATVERVDAIKPVHNHSSSLNENFMLYAGAFYEKFSLLKEHYQKFYLHQQDLEKFYKKLHDEGEQDTPDGILKLIEELIEKYNNALTSLKRLEESIWNKQHTEKLHEILMSYQIQLGKIGITIYEDLSLVFSSSVFMNNLAYNEDYLSFLFDYQNGLVKKLFLHFKNIKASSLKMLPSYGEDQPSSIAGIILDQRY